MTKLNYPAYSPLEAVVEREVNCDSVFMLETLPPVATEIMKKCLGFQGRNQFI
jgi:hypothetical protein